MKKDEDLLFSLERGEKLSMERVANLLIPLMGAIYAKQQLATLEGKPLALSQAFRAVVRDIFTLSNEVVLLEKELAQRTDTAEKDVVN